MSKSGVRASAALLSPKIVRQVSPRSGDFFVWVTLSGIVQKMMGVYVGGVENPANNFPRWEFFTAGDAMIQVEICEVRNRFVPCSILKTSRCQMCFM